MPFSAILDVALFRDMIDAVSALVNECRVHADETGISVITVDSANIAMVHVQLGAAAFAAYDCPAPTELGIDVAKVRAVSGMISTADETVALERDGNWLRIKFGRYKYEIRLLDAGLIRKDPTKPILDLPAACSVAGWAIADVVKAAGVVSGGRMSNDQQQLVFTVDNSAEQALWLTAKDDIQDFARVFRAGEDVEFRRCAAARSVFSLDYLKDMAKSISRAATVEIQMGTNRPIQFTWRFAGEHGSLMYLLAPRLEQD